MSVAAVSMVKDEADVIEGTIRHLADEVDWLLVADNGSTDGTRDVLAELALDLPLCVVDDREVGYYQSRKMSELAARAAEHGATWIVPFDADELWVSPLGRIRDDLANARGDVAQALLFNHFATAIDEPGDSPFDTMVWRQRERGALPKVAFRYRPGAVVDQGNHGVWLGERAVTANIELEVRHFPYRSAAQMVRKARNGAAAYRASNLPEQQGAHWRAYGEILDRYGEEGLADVFREHFWYLSPTDSGLVRDPAPFLRWRR